MAKKKDDSTKEIVPAHDRIRDSDLDSIRKALVSEHAELVIEGMLNEDVRKRLVAIVTKEYGLMTNNDPEVIEYVVRETIGTGVIEEILKDESITDVGYNGRELIIESNDSKFIYDPDFKIDEKYIVRVVNKFANANNKEFTSKNPIFDGRFNNVRINAVHEQNTVPESGTTMALRVVRPRLALTEDNFVGFAPLFMLDFFEAVALSKSNVVISGTTGTGKTELHKLISKFIPFDDRILLIEDTPETFMKQMFKEKDIYSWVTNESVTVTDLIKAGLRNHPAWIMVTETRGKEAYEMIQAVLSGHSIITSLHATNAHAIPSRFVNMAKMGYEVSEEALLDDIRRYFHFGAHIRKVRYNGKVIRYLAEVVEFTPEKTHSIFKQRFVDGVYYYETTELSQEFRERMEEVMVTVEFPENFKASRPMSDKDGTFETVIPLDATGRPDFSKIKEMGTTLTRLMSEQEKAAEAAIQAVLDEKEETARAEQAEYDRIDAELDEQAELDAEIAEMAEQEERDAELLPAKAHIPVPRNRDVKPGKDIDDVIQRIMQKQKSAPSVPPMREIPIRRPEIKQKTAKEILEEKRRKIQDEDL